MPSTPSRRLPRGVLAAVALVVCASPAAAQLALEPVVSGLMNPVRLVSPPNDDRLFVVQQGGIIRVLEQDGTSLGVFLNVSSLVVAGGERGLLGLAFAPDYATSGRFYINYTGSGGHTRIARYHVSDDPNVADPAGEVLLTINQPYANHNGGHLEFGPDGMLYVGMGDGGLGGDPGNRAQDDNTLLGKMLRLDVSVAAGYAIPVDNPFVGEAPLDEIWAKGVRNPWTFCFDRLTGDLFIADVGQNRLEEIDFQPAASPGGENYGWRLMEGTQCYNPPTDCNDGSLTLPVFEYAHGGNPFRCSISGGQVYRGAAIPFLDGHYFFADYCSGQLWSLTMDGDVVATTTEWTSQLTPAAGWGGIASLGRDASGEIYVVDFLGGKVMRIVSDLVEPGQ